MSEGPDRPRVLAVDDEKEVADAYAVRLRDGYAVETAYGGEEALERVEEGTDVVLLDRRMPGVSGDEVLKRLREGDVEVRVIMLTAVDPGFDVIGMPFDDYLCKPVDQDDLLNAIDQQLRVLGYRRLAEYFELSAKRAVVEAGAAGATPADVEAYEELTAQIESLRSELLRLLDDFEEIEARFEGVDREP